MSDLDEILSLRQQLREARGDAARLRATLEWLQSRGRLGLDVHERIAKALAKEGK